MKCIFDRNRLAALAAAGLGLILAGSAQAAPYTAWMNEYTGDEPHTLALWNFNEGAATTDSSGNGYNLTIKSPAVAQAGGKFGWGLSMPDRSTANNNYAVASDSTSLFPTGSNPSLSIEMWVKFNDPIAGSGDQYLIDKRFSDNAGYQLLYRASETSPTLRFIVGSGTSTFTLAADSSFSADTWYHLAAVYDSLSRESKIYVNGNLIASKVAGSGFRIVNSTAAVEGGRDRPVRIGNRLGSSYGSFDGMIDGVRISDVAYEFAVPEPASGLAVGLLAAGWMLRRRRPRDLA